MHIAPCDKLPIASGTLGSMRSTVTFRALIASLASLASLVVSCSSSSNPAASADSGIASDVASDVANDGGADTLDPPKTVTPGSSIYEHAGPAPVGHTTFSLTDAARSRTLRVEVWYPADESARAAATTGTALEDLEPAGANHDALKKLVDAAPATCTRKRVGSAADAKPAGSAPFPVVVFSHCHDCMRFSAAAIAERLASHGFAVIAADHTGNTLYDRLAGKELPLDATTLGLRVADVRFVLDSVLDGSSTAPTAIPATLKGRFDAAKVGMMGHSFGSVTTGAVLAKDARFKAGFAIAAPFDFLGDTKLTDIKVPTFFLVAQEDNSISEIGNNLIRNDFKTISAPDFLVEIVDAGHWSFSDICGLDTAFMPGCGRAQRQTDSAYDLNYLDNEGARGVASSYAAAFFLGELMGDAAGLTFAKTAHPEGIAVLGKK